MLILLHCKDFYFALVVSFVWIYIPEGIHSSIQITSLGSFHYSGCYSKQNFEELMNFGEPQTILYQHTLVKEKCFDASTAYFEKKSINRINVIAIQRQLCIFLSITKNENITLHKVEEGACNQTAAMENYNIGGSFAVAMYCKNSDSCLQKNTRTFSENNFNNKYYSDDVNSGNNNLIPSENNFKGIPCVTEDCTTRIDSDGQVCQSFTPNLDIKRKERMEISHIMLYEYIPEANENPNLCIQSCTNPYAFIFNDSYNAEFKTFKYSILSIVSGYYKPIGFCHCSNDLQTFQSKRFEKCDRCSMDNKKCLAPGPSSKLLSITNKVYCNQQVDASGICPEGRKYCKASIICYASDMYETTWSACPGEIKKQKCPTRLSSNGWASWKCSIDGKFEGQPDFTNCTTDRLQNIKVAFERNTTTADKMLMDLQGLVKQEEYYGHDIEKINSVKSKITKRAVSMIADLEEHESVIADDIKVTGILLSNKRPWNQLNSTSKSETVTRLTQSVETTLFNFAMVNEDILNLTSDGHYTLNLRPIENDQEGFIITLFGKNDTQVNNTIKFPHASESSCIKILNISELHDVNIYYVGMLMNYSYMDQLIPASKNSLGNEGTHNENKIFNGEIISMTFQNETINKIVPANGVEVKFLHNLEAIKQQKTYFRRKLHPGEKRKVVLGSTVCAYWDTVKLVWSSKGCVKLKDRSNSQETTCKCDHLTAFAVLTDLHEYVGKDKGLETITLTLCSLSIFCLIATIICLSQIDIFNKERTTITIHLCAALIFGNLLLLLLVDREYFYLSQLSCTIVGVITHYVFLVAFGWMSVQGLYLYRMVVCIFPTGKNYILMYTIGAYSYPLVPVGLAVAVGLGVGDQPYGGEMFCWLNGQYIWSFLAPMSIIVFGNFTILLIAIRAVHLQSKSKIGVSPKRSNDEKKWIMGSISLSVLLGLTWISSFFTLLDAPTFPLMSYVFTILNASQGILIFILHCALNEKCRMRFLEKLKALRPRKMSNNSAAFLTPTNLRVTKQYFLSTTKINSNEVSIDKIRKPAALRNTRLDFKNHRKSVLFPLVDNKDQYVNEDVRKSCSVLTSFGSEQWVGGQKLEFLVPYREEMTKSKLFLRQSLIHETE